MTLYWWMHWFWITLWMFYVKCDDTVTIIHSNTTDLSLDNVSIDCNNSAKTNESVESPPTTAQPVTVKNITIFINSSSKSVKAFKKINYSPNMTTNNALKDNETVINCKNSIDTRNLTDNQLLINSSFNTVNDTSNLTYLGEEVNYNQSLVQNSERIGVEEDENEINILGGNLSAAGITGITLGCVVIVGIICGVSYFIYRTRGFNRPQVLNDRCSNPDSSGYIDDASVRDNSEEMYSLDNDSFLNSLEAMTIQNYWTDTVKHTKL